MKNGSREFSYLAMSLRFGVTMVVLHVSIVAQAAIPPRSKDSSPTLATGTRAGLATVLETQLALSLPLDRRIDTLRAQGPQGYKNLRQIMFDPASKIESRWRAVTAVGAIGGNLALPELERASRARSWELRSAALVTVVSIDKKVGAEWARRLLKDPALMVRLQAVQTLQEIGDRDSIPLLWHELSEKRNFHRGESLFIRPRIVEALAKLEGRGSAGKFMALLEDVDPKLHLPAMRGLARVTGARIGEEEFNPNKRRAMWQQWWTSSRRE